MLESRIRAFYAEEGRDNHVPDKHIAFICIPHLSKEALIYLLQIQDNKVGGKVGTPLGKLRHLACESLGISYLNCPVQHRIHFLRGLDQGTSLH